MSFVSAQPTELTWAAETLQGVASVLAAQAAAIHEMFVDTLGFSVGSSTATEAAGVAAAG